MIIIIGLGNPGKKFEKTRHNVGFRIVDEFTKRNNFPKFKLSKNFLAEISEGSFNGKKIILAKPQTFMNNSGRAIKLLIQKRLKKAMAELRRRYDFLWVIHDDIDLPLGKIRISVGRGAAGHKGVQSIIDELETKDFMRFRVGIKLNSKCKMQNYIPPHHPPAKAGPSSELQFKIQNFVLKKFTKDEEKIMKKIIKKAVKAIECSLKLGPEKAMQKYNK